MSLGIKPSFTPLAVALHSQGSAHATEYVTGFSPRDRTYHWNHSRASAQDDAHDVLDCHGTEAKVKEKVIVRVRIQA